MTIEAQTVIFDNEPVADLPPIRIYCTCGLVIMIDKKGKATCNADIKIRAKTKARTLSGITRFLKDAGISFTNLRPYRI